MNHRHPIRALLHPPRPRGWPGNKRQQQYRHLQCDHQLPGERGLPEYEIVEQPEERRKEQEQHRGHYHEQSDGGD